MIQVPAIRKSRAVQVQTRTWRLDLSRQEQESLMGSLGAQERTRYYLRFPMNELPEAPEEPLEILQFLDIGPDGSSLRSLVQLEPEVTATLVHSTDHEFLKHLENRLRHQYIYRTTGPGSNPGHHPVLDVDLPRLLFYGQYREALLKAHERQYVLQGVKDQMLLRTRADTPPAVYVFPDELGDIPYQEVTSDPQYLLQNLLHGQS